MKKQKPLQATDVEISQHIEFAEKLILDAESHLWNVRNFGGLKKSESFQGIIDGINAAKDAVEKLQGEIIATPDEKIRLDLPPAIKFAQTQIRQGNAEFAAAVASGDKKPIATLTVDLSPPKRKRLTVGDLWDKFCRLR